MQCSVCGGVGFRHNRVIWDGLSAAWQLSPAERDYIDRQQGTVCEVCRSTLRSVALAEALRKVFGTSAFLAQFVQTPESANISLLEINEAGSLHPVLSQMKGHVFGEYPDVDMCEMRFPDGSFDVVVHSDTLEHIPNPVRALAECRRVLKPGGALCFTVPIVVGRMTRNRAGLAPSYHGGPSTDRGDFVVHTEYGADVWTQVLEAGFNNVRIDALEYPAALAITAFA